MRVRPVAFLAAALAASARAGTVRVEVVPELGGAGAAPSASAAPGAVPLQLPAVSLLPSALAPSPPAAPFAALPRALPSGAVMAASVEERPLLIKSLAAPALDVSKLGFGDASGAAEADFYARAQLGAPAALGGDVLAAPSGELAPRKPRLALVPAAKSPAARPAEEGAPLDVVPTAESLRALTSDGGTRLLIRTPEGRWRLVRREPRSPAYPTPDELAFWAGRGGRAFVVSKAGLVEWNPEVPPDAARKLSAAPWRPALRVPLLADFVLARAGVAWRRTPWKEVLASGPGAGEPPLDERLLVERTIPALVAAEFPVIAAKLGRSADAAYRADVLRRTNGYRMYWHSGITYKDHPDHVGIPDGHFRADFGIRLMVKPDWRRLKDLSANYRPLFAHEYVHWLQNEGFVSTKFGAEIAAVAVESLRAIELVGLDEVRAGRAGTVHAGVMSSFDGGREWARGGFRNEATPYLKGALAGAAFEAGVASGRPEAAWEFLNLVVAGEGALEPAAAWARVVGSR